MFSKSSRHRRLLTGFLFALLALAIYYPSVPGALDFDDYPSVRDNLSIRSLWPIWDAMWAEKENPLAGRPIPNLTMAVNYAIHGLNPEGYRLTNIALHVVCAMLIFAIVRRTLLLAHPAQRVPWLVHCQMATPDDGQGTVTSRAYVLSLLVTLLWLLHPLNSETVAYITQRTELSVALFLLLTLYCVVRAADSAKPTRWRLLAVTCCALGMLSKEVMVGAPLLVLFYERCFIHSTWKETLRRSWLMYLGLAATWLILAGITISGPRTRSVGFHLGISVWDYLKAQAISLTWYLWLCIWPEGLRLTYWWGLAPAWQRAAPSGLLILMLLGLSLRGLINGRPYGFLGIWCFVILAPSSSFVPIVTEITADRRMYLPSAAIVCLLVLGGYRVLHTWRPQLSVFWRDRIPMAALLLVMVIMGSATWNRAVMFGDPILLWKDNVRLEPTNPFANNNLASRYSLQGDHYHASWYFMEALHYHRLNTIYTGLARGFKRENKYEQEEIAYRYALRMNPHYLQALNSYGLFLIDQDRHQEALEKLNKSLELAPKQASSHGNLGLAYFRVGQYEQAVPHLANACSLDPESAKYHAMLGMSHRRLNNTELARQHLTQAVELDPEDALALSELGMLCAALGDIKTAANHYQKAADLEPDNLETRHNLAAALLRNGNATQAIEQFRVCLQLDAKHLPSHLGLAKALGDIGDAAGAEAALQELLKIEPDAIEALQLLGDLYQFTDRLDQALAIYQRLVRLAPSSAPAHHGLGLTLARMKKMQEAVVTLAKAVELDPGNKDYQHNLERARSLLQP